jgi:hypothetical protein
MAQTTWRAQGEKRQIHSTWLTDLLETMVSKDNPPLAEASMEEGGLKAEVHNTPQGWASHH